MRSALLLVAAALALRGVDGARMEISAHFTSSWAFLTRFCFKAAPPGTNIDDAKNERDFGYFEYEVTHKANDKLTLLFYYAGFEAYKNIAAAPASRMDCVEKMKHANLKVKLWNSQTYNVSNTDLVTTKSGMYFYGQRANWFFITLSNCDSSCLRPHDDPGGAFVNETWVAADEPELEPVFSSELGVRVASPSGMGAWQASDVTASFSDVLKETIYNISNILAPGDLGRASSKDVYVMDAQTRELEYQHSLVSFATMRDLNLRAVVSNPDNPYGEIYGNLVYGELTAAMDDGSFDETRDAIANRAMYENDTALAATVSETGSLGITSKQLPVPPTMMPTVTPEIYDNYCQGAVQAEVKLHMTNSGKAKMAREFSYDEEGVFQLYIVCTSLYALLAIWATLVGWALQQRRKYHHTARILVWSIYLETAAVVMRVAHWANFANNGVGLVGLEAFSIYVHHCAQLVVIILLILLAKGWTIVRRKVSVAGRMKLGIYATVYMSTLITALLWRDMTANSQEVVYYMEAPPGIMLACMNIVAALWFRYAGYITSRDFKMKRGFYSKFNFLFGAYLIHVPVVVAVALAMPDYVRSKVVETMTMIFTFLGQFVLLTMYNPNTEFNKSFPFHANTASTLMGRRFKGAGGAAAGGASSDPVTSVSGGGASFAGGACDKTDAAGKISMQDEYEKLHFAKLVKVHQTFHGTAQQVSELSAEMKKLIDKVNVDGEVRSLMEQVAKGDDDDLLRRRRKQPGGGGRTFEERQRDYPREGTPGWGAARTPGRAERVPPTGHGVGKRQLAEPINRGLAEALDSSMPAGASYGNRPGSGGARPVRARPQGEMAPNGEPGRGHGEREMTPIRGKWEGGGGGGGGGGGADGGGWK